MVKPQVPPALESPNVFTFVLIWIGIGDWYDERFLLLWEIILKISDFKLIITYFETLRMRQIAQF